MKKIILLVLICLDLKIFADDYISGTQCNQVQQYKKAKVIATRYLAYRDIDAWLAKAKDKEALDYGSGLGFSAEFLLTKAFKVSGVDTNLNMVQEAQKNLENVPFYHIETGKLPFADSTFDLVFSSLVLFELDSKEAIQKYLAEARRVMHETGIFIGITGSTAMGDPTYQSQLYFTNFTQNYGAKSGDLIKIKLFEIGLTFSDFLWSEDDYRELFHNAGLPICAVHYPLGRDGEGYPWLDEKQRSPLLLILAAKECAN